MNKILARLREPTTVTGLSALVGTAAGAMSGAMSWQAAVPLLAGGVVAIVLPDNTSAQAAIQHVTADMVVAEQAIASPPAMQGRAS